MQSTYFPAQSTGYTPPQPSNSDPFAQADAPIWQLEHGGGQWHAQQRELLAPHPPGGACSDAKRICATCGCGKRRYSAALPRCIAVRLSQHLSVSLHAPTWPALTHCEKAAGLIRPSLLLVPPPNTKHVCPKTMASLSAHRLWCCAQSQIFQRMAFPGRWAALMCPEVRLCTFSACSHPWTVCSRGDQIWPFLQQRCHRAQARLVPR